MEVLQRDLSAYSLVSYNLSGLSPSVKTKVSQMVYGKKSIKKVNDKKYVYDYKGLKDKEGVSLISESTLLMPREMVDSFIAFLDENNVQYKVVDLWK